MSAAARHPEVVAAVAARLAAAGVPSPAADARWLVEHVDGVIGDPVGCGAALLDGLVARRLAREPLQLILGSAAFRTVEVAVAPGVFIPRPETEVVAGLAIAAAEAAARAPGRRAPVRLVEPCTGTGAISCSLLAELGDIEVVATDLDPSAVALAARNLATIGAGRPGRAQVRLGSLLAPVEPTWRGTVDVLVANPPYLPIADRGSWEPEVSDHDPDRALVGGVDGHEVVDALLAAAAEWLAPGGTVVLEIDERRGSDALACAARVGLVDARVERDLTGADRVLHARRASLVAAGQGDPRPRGSAHPEPEDTA